MHATCLCSIRVVCFMLECVAARGRRICCQIFVDAGTCFGCWANACAIAIFDRTPTVWDQTETVFRGEMTRYYPFTILVGCWLYWVSIVRVPETINSLGLVTSLLVIDRWARVTHQVAFDSILTPSLENIEGEKGHINEGAPLGRFQPPKTRGTTTPHHENDVGTKMVCGQYRVELRV